MNNAMTMAQVAAILAMAERTGNRPLMWAALGALEGDIGMLATLRARLMA